MKMGFWFAILVGGAIEFLMEAWFFHGATMKGFIMAGSLLGLSIAGGLIGLAGGLYVRHMVMRDKGDGSALETLGIFIGFPIGYLLYCMLAFNISVLSAVVLIASEVGVYLICYESAVRRRRKIG
ncbi:MAG: hypothetical protein A2Z88_05220 [Omnitrophica WOR_2 bacterium GWA2_47_8]|nr:MAG: hypothetical protein A2Z88_05220 [Omnitrophica WOR_2 bacterium GWA2_47_8]